MPRTPALGCASPASRSARRSTSSWSPRARSPGRPSTTSRRSSGSGPGRTWSSSAPRARARAPRSSHEAHAAVEAGIRVPSFAAATLVESLYRGLADNSVGRLIEGLLRADLVIVDDLGFAPLDDVGAQLLFRFVAAAYERRSLGVASHWPFESWGRFLPEHTHAVALLDRLLPNYET